MAKAMPGAPYIVVAGDTLFSIAKQAYGDGRQWRKIWQSNSTVLRSGNPNLIFPGETIMIPPHPVVESVAALNLFGDVLPTLPGKDPDDFTIQIDGTEIPVLAGRVVKTADTIADAWTATIRFDTEDSDLVELLLPYRYRKASCYLGETLACETLVYRITTRSNPDEQICDVHGFTKTAVLLKSCAKAPYEQKEVNLEARIKHLVKPHGIEVISELPSDPVAKKFVISATEKIFEHIHKHATERGVLLSCTELGQIKLVQPAASGSIGVIEEATSDGQEYRADFDGMNRYNTYMVLSQTPGRKKKGKKETKIRIAKDSAIADASIITYRVDETEASGMENAAEWRRSKQVAESMEIEFPVSSWYGPDGELWKPNTIVTVISPTIFVPDGFDFLIRRVEFNFTDVGTTAILGLIPPQAYTGEPLDEPWASSESRALNLVDRVIGSL